MTKNMDELVERYGGDGDTAKAVANAEQEVFDLIRKSGDGVPLELMYQVLDIWMEWSVRLVAGTLMNVAGDVHEWSPEQVDKGAKDMVKAFMLLKQDAFRSVLDGSAVISNLEDPDEQK